MKCKAEGCEEAATRTDPRGGYGDEKVVCEKHLDILNQWLAMVPPEWLGSKERL